MSAIYYEHFSIESHDEFPWKQTDPAFLAVEAILRVCNGSTVGSNFDLVAPFFISHLSTLPYNKNDGKNKSIIEHGSHPGATRDAVAEEYSLRISLMALLQTILSDESFSLFLNHGGSHDGSATVSFSSQFTTDVLLSLVLPNLVWKAGGMASALRKLAAASLFSLLRSITSQNAKSDTAQLHPEMISHLVPVLHSNLEDTESTTRELSCVCLSFVLEQMSAETFNAMWETNARAIDSLYPRLLDLLDDSHDPVRMASCNTLLTIFLRLAHDADLEASSSYSIGISSLENIISSLLIQLDDPDKQIQEHIFQVISSLIELQFKTTDQNSCEKTALSMMKKQIDNAMNCHRNRSYCQALLDKISEFEMTCGGKSVENK